MTTQATGESHGFWNFYREYAGSGIHAATAAGLTLFGTLTFVHWGFAVVGVAVYVLPLAHFYLADDRTDDGTAAEEPASTPTSEPEPDPNSDSEPEPEPDSISTSATESNSGAKAASGQGSEPTPMSASTDGARSASVGDGPADASIDADADADTDVEGETEPEPRDRSGGESEVRDGRENGDDGDVGADPDTDTDAPREWVTVESPTDEPLYDVAVAGGAVFAVGDNGVVLARRGGEWEAVLERGPAVESNPLWGVDATEDGKRVWFCGDSGALGQYDVAGERLTDRSAPRDQTSTWEDVAVTGPAGNERVLLVNGSGEVLHGRNDDGDLQWDELRTPGSGSSLSSIEFEARDTGYCCDTNQGVFETTDGGDSWERIGIDDAGGDFNDLAICRNELLVAGDDGSVFRYDDPGWTKLYVGEETIFAIDRSLASGNGNEGDVDGENGSESERGLAVGDNGAVYELLGNNWERVESPTDETLCGVLVGPGALDVAVGDDGTVLERGE